MTPDPFRPWGIGARPSLAALWPDTRFLDLVNPTEYLATLTGQRFDEKPDLDSDDPAIDLLISIIQHEKIHWWQLHARSWGLLRAHLKVLQMLLPAALVRSLPTQARQLAFEGR